MLIGKPRNLRLLMCVLLFAIAFLLRLYTVNHTVIDDPLRADAHDYYSYALNLKHHGIYSKKTYLPENDPLPDAVRPPVYPLFLLPLADYPPNLDTIWRIKFFQALIDSLTVLLALGIYRRLMSEGWAMGAAILTALSPHLINMTTHILSETLFTFLVVLSLWTAIKAYERNTRLIALLAGLLVATAALTRPTLQYFIVPLALMMLFAVPASHRRLAIPLVVGFAILFTPWSMRNIHATGHISDPTLTINAYHHGMYPDFRFQDRRETQTYPYRFNPRVEEITQSVATIRQEIVRRFREEPVRHATWYMLGKPVSLLSWNIVQGIGDIFVFPIVRSPWLQHEGHVTLRKTMKLLHWPLVTLALLATVLVWIPAFSRKLTRGTLFVSRMISLLISYFIVLHIVATPLPRYGIPLRPFLYGLAVFCCYRVYHMLGNRMKRPKAGQEEVG